MESYDLTFARGRRPDFDEAPNRARCRVFGVDYLHLKGMRGGDLFFTRFGWPVAASLVPDQWFKGEQFAKRGRALAGATGAVYRVPVPHEARPSFAVIVKFSRFGQDIGITINDLDDHFDARAQDRLVCAEFLPPFEEFGNLMRLRAALRRQIATNLPLAIYSPPTRYLSWQLGRKPHLQWLYTRQLKSDQNAGSNHTGIEYQWERIYILLYRWMDGMDAEQAARAGVLDSDALKPLTLGVLGRLRNNGWTVLDHKPRHVILRTRRNKREILSRGGAPVIGLIDYELLVPEAIQ